MPISQRKLEANRRNAARSTGPRTSSGKARSAQNSRKHGLRANPANIPTLDGDPAEFTQFHQSFFADLRPATPAQAATLDLMVTSAWQMQRAQQIEANRLNELCSESPDTDPLHTLGHAATQFAASGELDALSRYETTHRRAFYRALSQIHQLRQNANLPNEATVLSRPTVILPNEPAAARTSSPSPLTPLAPPPSAHRLLSATSSIAPSPKSTSSRQNRNLPNEATMPNRQR